MKIKWLIYIIFLLIVSVVQAQQIKPIESISIIISGDTLPLFRLKEVKILSLKIPKTRKGRKRLTRLVRNVKKVYPYARMAGIKLRQYDILMTKAKNKKERRRLMRRAEKEIKAEYGKPLEHLTFTQGKILIKLIYRETGNSSYDLVKELRGNFTAFFYQTFARIWGYNLKMNYDPKGKDYKIETIVTLINQGKL